MEDITPMLDKQGACICSECSAIFTGAETSIGILKCPNCDAGGSLNWILAGKPWLSYIKPPKQPSDPDIV